MELAARFKPVAGVLVLLAVVLPWYGLCALANGWGFVEEFLIRHNLERFFTDRYEHPQPFWFFPAVALIGFFPWSLQLIPSARGLFRHGGRWRSLAAAQDLFLWLWLLTPLVVFSVSRSKLPGYLLPAAPAIALLIGHQVRLWLRPDPGCARPLWFKDFYFYQALCLIVTGLALPFYATRLNLPVESLAGTASGLLAGTGVLALLFYWRRRRTASVSCYLAAVALAVILVTGGVFAQVDAAESSPTIGDLPSGRGGIPGSTPFRLRNLAQCGLWTGLLPEQPCPDRLFGRRRALSEGKGSLLCNLARL